ncbi:response regulator [Enterococcus rivorum]|uniref:response regulator n=1 Tax=Enterococcus rivorum TaxID=762845 RepID=UPI003627E2E5
MNITIRKYQFQVRAATDFQNIVNDIADFEPDLVLLDISLPFYNGYYWCGEIRRESKLPIIFISSASDNMNIVMAINMGADDFIAKPFDLPVFIAKIQALLRRTYDFSDAPFLQFKEYCLDLTDNLLFFEKESILLTNIEVKILSLLFQEPNQLIMKEKIMERLRENETFVDSTTLSVNMNRLKKSPGFRVRQIYSNSQGERVFLR